MLFALKLTLVPVFIAGVTLGSRRWGPRIGGWLNAVPMVAGPALLFLAIEQGTAFAARAALNTLAGLIGVAAFCLAYGWAALQAPSPFSCTTCPGSRGPRSSPLRRRSVSLASLCRACAVHPGRRRRPPGTCHCVWPPRSCS